MVIITGSHGFIGSALKYKIDNQVIEVDNISELNSIDEDMRRRKPTHFFHFGSPSSNIIFNQYLEQSISDTVKDFIDVCNFCRKHHCKLIYPSSGTIYKANNNYSRTKKALEEIQQAYDFPILALRIFAGYGVGEKHKRDYASVIYQWCKQMEQGERPIVYGDGSQTRDFIYIEDIVNAIINNKDNTGFLDIGSGENHSFNDIVSIINKCLNSKIEPIYIGEPSKYIKETLCVNPIEIKIGLESGIKKILKSL